MKSFSIRGLLAVAVVVAASPALASTCFPESPMKRNGPSVIISGTVERVEVRQEKVGTFFGAGSISSRPGRVSGSNTAIVRVDKLIRGNVGDLVEITSDLQDGINLGQTFRKGPLVVGAYRRKDGKLYASACSTWLTGDRAEKFDWSPSTFNKQNELGDAFKVSNEISLIGDPRDPIGLTSEEIIKLDSLLDAISDGERRVAMWLAVTDSYPSANAYHYLARANVDSNKLEEAKEAAQRSIDLGNVAASSILNTVKLLEGLPANTSGVNLSGRNFKNLLIDKANFSGTTVKNLEVRNISADNSNWKASRFENIFIAKGSLKDADFSDAQLVKSMILGDFSGSSFRGVGMQKTQMTFDGGNVDFSGSKGSEIVFLGDLSSSKFDAVVYDGVRFISANLDNSTFRGAATLRGSFESVSVRGADLSELNTDGLRWNDVRYSCSTKFPKGFDPVAQGFRNEEVCPGQAEVDLSESVLKVCDEFCYRWLIEREGRYVNLHLDRGAKYRLFASFPGKGLCAPEAVKAWRPITGYQSSLELTSLPDENFCPDIRLPHANPIDRLFRIKQTNPLLFDVDQIAFFDKARLEDIGFPAIINYYRSGDGYRFSVLHSAVQYFDDASTTLADLMMEAIQEKDFQSYYSAPPRDVGDYGAPQGFVSGQRLSNSQRVQFTGYNTTFVKSEAADVRDLGRAIGYSNSQRLATRAFSILRKNPHLAERPGFRGLFHGVLAKAPFARGEEFCQNLIEASKYKEQLDVKLDSRVDSAIQRCIVSGQ